MKLRNNKWHTAVTSILFVSLLVVAQACSKSNPSAPVLPTDQDASGLYTKNGTSTATFNTVDVPLLDIKGMVYGALPNQKFIFFDMASNVLIDGVITAINLTDITTGTAVVYKDGVMVDNDIKVTGTVTSRSTVNLTLTPNTTTNFDGGTISGLFTSVYDFVATKARIKTFNSSRWNASPPVPPNEVDGLKMAIARMGTDNFSIPFSVDNSYSYSSNTFNVAVKCDHAGTLTPDSPKNIYPLLGEMITATTNCTITNSPDYIGFASVVAVDSNGKGTEMWYATTNGTNSIFAILKRP